MRICWLFAQTVTIKSLTVNTKPLFKATQLFSSRVESSSSVFQFLIEEVILDILKIQGLKTTNRDRKIANKQDIRYCSIDSNGLDNM